MGILSERITCYSFESIITHWIIIHIIIYKIIQLLKIRSSVLTNISGTLSSSAVFLQIKLEFQQTLKTKIDWKNNKNGFLNFLFYCSI